MKRQILKVIVLTLASAVAFSAARAAVGDVVASATSQKTWMDMASCANATTVITVGENAEPVKVSYSGRTWYAGTAMGTSALYDNDVLVRDFIPVLDSNGTPCMLDKVEGKFYYNQGTGQFIAGPAI